MGMEVRAGVIALALLTAGCGGGGGNGDDSPPGSTVMPPPNAGDPVTDDLSETPPAETPARDESPGDEMPAPEAEGGENFKPLQGVFRVSDRRPDEGLTLSFSGGFVRSDTAPADHEIFRERDVCDPLSTFEAATDGRRVAREEVGVGAGDVLVVSNASGTLATLPRVGYSAYEDYFLDGVVVDAASARGLVLDIPGAEYPAWSGVAIPDDTRPVGMQPALSAPVTAGTVFRWEAGSSALSHVGIGASFIADDVRYSLNCFGPDDGELAIPEDLRETLGDAVADGWSISRRVFVDFAQGDASLEVQRYFGP